MKAKKYYIMPVVIMSCLVANVYAGAPAYIKSFAASAVENGVYNFFKTIYYLVMFALILAAAYFVTKYLARKGMVQGKTKNMKLLETMPLGAEKSLHLVKVGAQYFLIGSAAKNMFMMSELNEEKLFQNQLDGSLDLSNMEYENYDDSLENKDFGTYFNSVKHNLHKLKSMVRGNSNNE